MQRLHITLVFPIFLLSSCFREDEKVSPHNSGNVSSNEAALTETYATRVYVDLGTNTILKHIQKTDWDLEFECSDSSWLIRLNNSKFMKATNTGFKNFLSPVDTTGAEWLFDAPSGDPDSTAIGKWVDVNTSPLSFTNDVYVIDLGSDADGIPLGYRKIQFYNWTDASYSFRYAMLDGSGQDSFTIMKNPARLHIGFSFTNGGQAIDFQPPKDAWDIVFTQYSTILYSDAGVPTPYLVLGVLISGNNVEAGVLENTDFTSVTFDSVKFLQLSRKQDIIGYEWKKYDFDNGVYTVESKNVYIIKDTEGYLYKLRFTGFYNNNGDKGYPRFEFQRL